MNTFANHIYKINPYAKYERKHAYMLVGSTIPADEKEKKKKEKEKKEEKKKERKKPHTHANKKITKKEWTETIFI